MALTLKDICHFCSYSTGQNQSHDIGQLPRNLGCTVPLGQLSSRNRFQLWKGEHECVGTQLAACNMGSGTHTTQSNMYSKCEYTIFNVKYFKEKLHRYIAIKAMRQNAAY